MNQTAKQGVDHVKHMVRVTPNISQSQKHEGGYVGTVDNIKIHAKFYCSHIDEQIDTHLQGTVKSLNTLVDIASRSGLEGFVFMVINLEKSQPDLQ